MIHIINLIFLSSLLVFCWKRLMTFLHALQQDDYDNRRFLSWIIENKVFDKRVSFGFFGLGILAFFLSTSLTTLAAIFLIGSFAYIEADPRTRSKKKLVLTARAKRILIPALFLCFLFILPIINNSPFLLILFIQAIPIILVLSNLINHPYEKIIQKKYYDEAKLKLDEIRPKIIAITGSFGKTSLKHILGHVLNCAAPTLITPGSVNTVMGITRIVREQMQPNTKYFIVEMGAYGPGSIAKLCALTPPDMGIITAIGQAHYERFKTLDTVAQAKYELANDVISRNGIMVVEEKTLNFSSSQAIYSSNQDRFIVCGKNLDNDLIIHSIEQTQDGLLVKLEWQKKLHIISAPLFGLHHGFNVALCFAASASLGIDPSDIKAALARVPQITHRLEVKKSNDGSILIDDAFNSNPVGFTSALELLPILKNKGRSILITPGMVELGEAHSEEHTKIGSLAAQNCDIVLVVNPQRIPTFISAFKTSAPEKILLEFSTFQDAQTWLLENRKAGDVVLLENDLPDIYERIPKL